MQIQQQQQGQEQYEYGEQIQQLQQGQESPVMPIQQLQQGQESPVMPIQQQQQGQQHAAVNIDIRNEYESNYCWAKEEYLADGTVLGKKRFRLYPGKRDGMYNGGINQAFNDYGISRRSIRLSTELFAEVCVARYIFKGGVDDSANKDATEYYNMVCEMLENKELKNMDSIQKDFVNRQKVPVFKAAKKMVRVIKGEDKSDISNMLYKKLVLLYSLLSNSSEESDLKAKIENIIEKEKSKYVVVKPDDYWEAIKEEFAWVHENFMMESGRLRIKRLGRNNNCYERYRRYLEANNVDPTALRKDKKLLSQNKMLTAITAHDMFKKGYDEEKSRPVCKTACALFEDEIEYEALTEKKQASAEKAINYALLAAKDVMKVIEGKNTGVVSDETWENILLAGAMLTDDKEKLENNNEGEWKQALEETIAKVRGERGQTTQAAANGGENDDDDDEKVGSREENDEKMKREAPVAGDEAAANGGADGDDDDKVVARKRAASREADDDYEEDDDDDDDDYEEDEDDDDDDGSRGAAKKGAAKKGAAKKGAGTKGAAKKGAAKKGAARKRAASRKADDKPATKRQRTK